MASRPWSNDELAVLERHASDDDWLPAVTEEIRDRSYTSLTVKMMRLRERLGIKPRRGARVLDDQEADNAKAVIATQRLLQATLRVGTWS